MEFPRPTPRRRPRESVIPLVNVVFLLLIFFLLAGSLEAPDLWPVEPPVASEAQPALREQAQLLLAADGRIAFREQPLPRDALAAAVADHLDRGGDPVVQVKADGRARSGDLLQVLEALRSAGVAELDLLAERAP